MRVPVKKYILKAKIGGRLICEVGLYASIYGTCLGPSLVVSINIYIREYLPVFAFCLSIEIMPRYLPVYAS